jgi:hypothetical protein
MKFSTARPDVVQAINQRWLLTFWTRHLGEHRIPLWQTIESESLSRLSDNLSFLDVVADTAGTRFQIRFHGPVVAQVFGAADCRGQFLYQSLPEPTRAQKLAPYRQAVDSGQPVYTVHDIADRNGRLVHYERLLLPFSHDGKAVDRILTSFEFVCEDGAFERRELMTAPPTPPTLRLSVTITPRKAS